MTQNNGNSGGNKGGGSLITLLLLALIAWAILSPHPVEDVENVVKVLSDFDFDFLSSNAETGPITVINEVRPVVITVVVPPTPEPTAASVYHENNAGQPANTHTLPESPEKKSVLETILGWFK